jgi:hypothetical protein
MHVRSLDRASCVHVKRCQERHERAAKLKMQAMLQVRRRLNVMDEVLFLKCGG